MYRRTPNRRSRTRQPWRLRGEMCIGTASFLSFTSFILLLFAHVGQINTSAVPRHLSMVNVNVSGYGITLQNAIGDPVDGLYTSNASAPLGEQEGLRQRYSFGLYSYCGYVDATHGTCSNKTAAFRLQPYNAMLSDMSSRFSGITLAFISANLTFTNSHYVAEFSNAASYLLLIGTICAFLAFVTGLIKRTYMYLLSSIFAILGASLLFIGTVIWTVLLNKAKDVNKLIHTSNTSDSTTPLGIYVSGGFSLWLFWTGFVLLFISILPYLLFDIPRMKAKARCCDYPISLIRGCPKHVELDDITDAYDDYDWR